VGAFDIPASRYGIKVQGADEIALTKLDVLSYMEKIPVCVAYEIEEKRTDRFPIGESLLKAKPIIELMDGWKCDISSCRKKEDLPEAASAYIRFIEEMSRCRIRYVSVGAERDAYIDMDAV
jgi:adenylosuccinate synthase